MISADGLKKVFIHAKSAMIAEFIDEINATQEKYEINTPLRQAHFLAQVGHESGELRYREEIASGAAYEGRKDLGNTRPGDGRRFKGRGLIQLTGHDNYVLYGRHVGIDLLANPELVAIRTDLCVDVAGWFWHTHNLNGLADQDGIKRITRRINGGFNGLEDRMRILLLAKSILN